MAVKTLRTPDDRFEGLPGYPFAPHYTEVPDGEGDTLRIHYLDEGPSDGQVVLLLHGEPSWSYLYRTMIPVLSGAGHRVVVPDLVGFGRSDKPTRQSDYTYVRHVEWMRAALFDNLDLSSITLYCQDWGGLIGLRLVAEHPDRFARVCVADTFLPTGEGANDAFRGWRDFAATTEVFDAGAIVSMGTVSDLPDDVVAAYNAPFPDATYQAGARVFPALVPVEPDDPAVPANRAAWEVLRGFTKPFLVAYADSDPILGSAGRFFLADVPGTEGQPHRTIESAGHFLQEDQGPVIAQHLVEWMAS